MNHCSILVITHNNERYLKQHLSNYCRLATLEQADLMVFDTGSTDQTTHYMHTHFPNVRYHSVHHYLSLAEAFNQAIESIHTPYILWLHWILYVTRYNPNWQSHHAQHLLHQNKPC